MAGRSHGVFAGLGEVSDDLVSTAVGPSAWTILASDAPTCATVCRATRIIGSVICSAELSGAEGRVARDRVCEKKAGSQVARRRVQPALTICLLDGVGAAVLRPKWQFVAFGAAASSAFLRAAHRAVVVPVAVHLVAQKVALTLTQRRHILSAVLRPRHDGPWHSGLAASCCGSLEKAVGGRPGECLPRPKVALRLCLTMPLALLGRDTLGHCIDVAAFVLGPLVKATSSLSA
mmetsp:Transcript_35445/g.88083  ORF Transcript_35445/g.88083 Transcript_35445/m.88083 type:complete len:233 (+) Transcript_35445:1370-2068(+)